MTLILDLPPELESELAAEAAHLKLPLTEYALRILAEGRGQRPTLKTGAELVAYWQQEGLIGTHPQIADLQSHARDLREESQHRTGP